MAQTVTDAKISARQRQGGVVSDGVPKRGDGVMALVLLRRRLPEQPGKHGTFVHVRCALHTQVMLHPACCILHAASCILHPASCILRPASLYVANE